MQKSVSTTMLFLLMPVALFLTYPAVNKYMNQFGLKNKSQLAGRFEVCTPAKHPLNNWQGIFSKLFLISVWMTFCSFVHVVN